MAWRVHYRRDGQAQQESATVLSDALALACRLLREGHTVEKVQSDSGMALLSRDVQPLCDTPRFRDLW